MWFALAASSRPDSRHALEATEGNHHNDTVA